MTPPPTLLVTMATYNERENLPDLVRQVLEVVPFAELLVVDDNSPDGTGRWLAEQAAADTRIQCLHRPRKMGLGSATVDALKFAVQHGYAFVVALDADGSHDPHEIPRMLADQRGPGRTSGRRHRLAIRSRRRHRGLALVPPWHEPRHQHVRPPGPGTVRAGLQRRIPLHPRGDAPARGLVDHSQSRICVPGRDPVAIQTGGAGFEEIPIVFANRRRGTSKINTRESLAALWMLFRLGLRNWLKI